MAAKGSEVGNGYVLIKPTMDESAISNLEAHGQRGGQGFGGAFSVAAGNLISSAVEKIASAAVDVFKNAFDNYANYEQLVGGVDTLFKESSAIVQENAANAFRTAGMSANEYMENVTSFSASLLQSLGGDTAKAAEYADRAMIDMSDNANKMGTDMSRITDAYQGFAKDNYTMLDNLKLGYGGTKEEMKRLISDAAKMTDVQEELGVTVDESSMSFGNVVNAISVMQKSMGIAGTTAEEGAKTISGSINKLSASWQNFLTGIFDENADVGLLGEQLFESVGDVLANVAPRIMVLVQRLIVGLPGAIIKALEMIPSTLAPAITAVFGEQLGGQINEALGGAFDGIASKLSTLGANFMTTMQAIWNAVQPLVMAIGELFTMLAPIVTEAIGFITSFISLRVLPLIQAVAKTVQPVIEQIAASIQEHMPEIQAVIETVMGVVKNIINTVWPFVQSVVISAVEAISEIVEHVWPVVSEIITVACNVIQDVINVAWPIIQSITETVFTAIQGIAETVWPIISGIVETAADAIKGAIEGISYIVGVVQGIFDAVKSAIENPMETAKNFIGGIIDTIKGFFNFDIQWPHIPLPHFEAWGSPNPLDWLEGGLPGFSIEWYAKGGFVDNATLIGAGEKGPEMILPQRGILMDEFASTIAEKIGGAGVDIHDCTFNVRDESDIRRVAEELNTLINRQAAGAFA